MKTKTISTNMKAATFINISLKNVRNLLEAKPKYHFIRYSSTVAQVKPKHDKMSSWQIHAYGDLSELQYSPQMRIPHITQPNQVLVKVDAASVNPIDVAMIGTFRVYFFERVTYFAKLFFIPYNFRRVWCNSVKSYATSRQY